MLVEVRSGNVPGLGRRLGLTANIRSCYPVLSKVDSVRLVSCDDHSLVQHLPPVVWAVQRSRIEEPRAQGQPPAGRYSMWEALARVGDDWLVIDEDHELSCVGESRARRPRCRGGAGV